MRWKREGGGGGEGGGIGSTEARRVSGEGLLLVWLHESGEGLLLVWLHESGGGLPLELRVSGGR
jgi:hypothetical protein